MKLYFRMWVVYKHTSPSGKVYIGITSNLKNRWASNGKKYCTYNSIFKKAIEKYGWNKFTHEIVLDNISKSEAIYAEKYLIRWYKIHNLSYNITDGGEGTLGMKFTQDRIQHIVASRVANNDVDYLVIDKEYNYHVFSTTQEAAKYLRGSQSNISNVLCRPIGYTYRKHYIWKHKKGTPVDIGSIKLSIQNALEQRYIKMSENNKIASKRGNSVIKKNIQAMSSEARRKRFGHKGMSGKHHSDETKRKLSEAAQNRDMNRAIIASLQSRRKKATPIIITKDDVFIGEFQILADACKDLSLNPSSAYRALHKGIKANGYNIKYKEEIYV